MAQSKKWIPISHYHPPGVRPIVAHKRTPTIHSNWRPPQSSREVQLWDYIVYAMSKKF